MLSQSKYSIGLNELNETFMFLKTLTLTQVLFFENKPEMKMTKTIYLTDGFYMPAVKMTIVTLHDIT